MGTHAIIPHVQKKKERSETQVAGNKRRVDKRERGSSASRRTSKKHGYILPGHMLD